MNGKSKILSVLFFLFLTLSALPAGAVSPYGDGVAYFTSKAHYAGTSFLT
ncbi:MAG: hypothetical protein ACHBNF_08360 [Chromatiales bacterium]